MIRPLAVVLTFVRGRAVSLPSPGIGGRPSRHALPNTNDAMLTALSAQKSRVVSVVPFTAVAPPYIIGHMEVKTMSLRSRLWLLTLSLVLFIPFSAFGQDMSAQPGGRNVETMKFAPIPGLPACAPGSVENGD